jgi:hypothetical protein
MPEEPYTTLRRARWQTYAIAFVITAAIFGTILYANNYFNDRRIAEIRATQDNISIDILSLETQFDLLAENSCAAIAENSVLSRELRPLAARLSYIESQAVFDTEELVRLKRYYSLLQIKDLILLERVAGKCNIEPVSILYFYSNEGDCEQCEAQGYALTALGEKYPQLRIYSFDYNLDLSALQTLISINEVRPDLPAIVIDGTVYSGYQNVDALEEALSQITDLEALRASTDTAEVATTTDED